MASTESDLALGDKRHRAADDQFTAGSMLQQAYESNSFTLKTPNYRIADLDELHYFQGRKRTEYENALRRNRFNYGQWMRYAQFEIDQHDFARARSVFERALEVSYKNVAMWVRYIQTEIKFKNINHARNLLERATEVLPRVDKLWYLYVTVEESLGNLFAVRQIFENWLQWKPEREVWLHYIEFEERYNEFENSRLIFEKFVVVYPDPETWIKWSEFEKMNGDSINIRNVYKLGVNSLFETGKLNSAILISWIQWELSQKEFNKVKKLYDFGLKTLSKAEQLKLQNFQADFERKYGNSQNIESSVLNKRKNKYESELESDPNDYELWWTYFNLLIDTSIGTTRDEIRLKFELLVSNPPIVLQKSIWLPYIYLCIRYAIWEEVNNIDLDASSIIYKKLLKIVPHKTFTFAKFWINYAEFELRHNGINAARKVLGQSIGFSANVQVINYYIDLEVRLKYFDRARTIYAKLLECFPHEPVHWIQYARFEEQLGDDPRSSFIIELAVFENFLNSNGKMEIIDTMLDSLISSYNFKLARRLLDYQLELSNWDMNIIIKRCLFELRVPTTKQIELFAEADEEEFVFSVEDEAKDRARKEFEGFIMKFKESKDIEKRIVLLESLKNFEIKYGNDKLVDQAVSRLPKITKHVKEDDRGNKVEYMEYKFPDDEEEIEREVDAFKQDFLLDFAKEEAQAQENTKVEFKSRFAADSDDDDNADNVGDVDDGFKEEISKPSFESRFEDEEELHTSAFNERFEK